MSTTRKDTVARSTTLLAVMATILVIGCTALSLWCPKALFFVGSASFFQWLWRRKKRLEADTVIAAWQKLVSDINRQFAKLYDTEFRELDTYHKQVGGFTGETLSLYQSVLADFSELASWQEAAEQQLEEAKKHARHCVFPFVRGFTKTVAILNDQPVTIAISRSLPTEGADNIGLLTVRKTCEPQPAKLLDLTSKLFERIVETTAFITEAGSKAQQNREKIEKQLAEFEINLSNNRIPLETYQRWLDKFEVESGDETVCDQVASWHASNKAALALPELKTLVDNTIELQLTLRSAEAEIEKVEGRVREVRGKNIGYNYPLFRVQTAPKTARDELFRLDEPEHNPDLLIAESRSHLKAALAAFGEGDLSRALEENKAAISSSQAAGKLVDAVLSDKRRVEEKVADKEVALSRLQVALQRAEMQLAELKTDLPAAEFKAQEKAIESARSCLTVALQEQDCIKQAYDKQHYFAGINTWSFTTQWNLRSSFQQLFWLLDKYCRSVCAVCSRKLAALKDKLANEKFAVSAAADAEYKRLNKRLVELGYWPNGEFGNLDQPALVQQFDTLSVSLDSLDSLIDVQCLLLARAREAVEAASTSTQAAKTKVDSVVFSSKYDPAPSKLNKAFVILDVARDTLANKPKSNWASVASQVAEAKALADEAMKLAEAAISS